MFADTALKIPADRQHLRAPKDALLAGGVMYYCLEGQYLGMFRILIKVVLLNSLGHLATIL